MADFITLIQFNDDENYSQCVTQFAEKDHDHVVRPCGGRDRGLVGRRILGNLVTDQTAFKTLPAKRMNESYSPQPQQFESSLHRIGCYTYTHSYIHTHTYIHIITTITTYI